jgi:DNA-binding MarR family transcriptional regulator
MSKTSGVNFTFHAGYLLAVVGRIAESAWAQFLRNEGLTNSEFTVLAILEGGHRTQREIADAASVDPRNMVATVRRLTKAKLVKANAAEDGRAKLLALTHLGRARMAKLETSLAPQREKFFSTLTVHERSELTRILIKLKSNHA